MEKIGKEIAYGKEKKFRDKDDSGEARVGGGGFREEAVDVVWACQEDAGRSNTKSHFGVGSAREKKKR